MRLWNKNCNFDFFENIFFDHYIMKDHIMKDLVDLEKIPEGPIMDRKSLNYFSAFWLRDESYAEKQRNNYIFDFRYIFGPSGFFLLIEG